MALRMTTVSRNLQTKVTFLGLEIEDMLILGLLSVAVMLGGQFLFTDRYLFFLPMNWCLMLLVLMIGGTVYSQYGIIPAMERDRKAAGGAIDTADITNPTTVHFNKLHNRSVFVEETILLLGLGTVVMVAWAETTRV